MKDPTNPIAHSRNGLASSFSLTEKLAPIAEFGYSCPLSEPRRAQPSRYPDFGLYTSLPLPVGAMHAWSGQWLWEFVARNSGATVPDSHGVPGTLAVIKTDRKVRQVSKNNGSLLRRFRFSKRNEQSAGEIV